MLSVVTADELAWPRASQLFVATTQLIPILCTEKNLTLPKNAVLRCLVKSECSKLPPSLY